MLVHFHKIWFCWKVWIPSSAVRVPLVSNQIHLFRWTACDVEEPGLKGAKFKSYPLLTVTLPAIGAPFLTWNKSKLNADSSLFFLYTPDEHCTYYTMVTWLQERRLHFEKIHPSKSEAKSSNLKLVLYNAENGKSFWWTASTFTQWFGMSQFRKKNSHSIFIHFCVSWPTTSHGLPI